MYQFSFLTIVQYVLLPGIRNAFHNAWMQTIITPLEELKEAFLLWKADVDVLATTTFQVISIEKILNDRFNISNPVQIIYIVDVDAIITPTFLFFEQEGEEPGTYLCFEEDLQDEQEAVHLFFEEEFAFQIDFRVMVPQIIYDLMITNGSMARMKKLINLYKMAGKNYEITPY